MFKACLSVREAQVIQESLDVLRVRYVPAAGFSDADVRSITGALRARVGAVRVILEEVDVIPRAKGGKFRAVVSQLVPAASSKGVLQ